MGRGFGDPRCLTLRAVETLHPCGEVRQLVFSMSRNRALLDCSVNIRPEGMPETEIDTQKEQLVVRSCVPHWM